MADGFTLIVPNEMLNRLQVADQKIAQLAKTSETTEKAVTASFRNMTDGVGRFINALNNANIQINSLSTNSSKLQQLASVLQQLKSGDKGSIGSIIDASKLTTAVDKINQLVTGLKNLKSVNKISLQIQQENVDYQKKANQIKEVANAQAQLARELERADKASAKNERNALALETQKLANATRELLNIEKQRQQNLSLDAGRSKNNHTAQSLEIKRQANELQALLNVEAERKRQLAINDAQSKNRFAEESLAAQRYANELRQLAEVERLRRQQTTNENAAMRNEMSFQSVEIKRQANDIKEAANAEAERSRQLALQNKRNIAAYKQEAAELKRITDEIDRQAKAYRAMPAAINSQQAGKYVYESMNATSINQRLTAIHNLRSAIKDLDVNDNRYDATLKRLNAEIKRHEQELRRAGVQTQNLNRSHRNLMDTAGQLQRKLALLVSVSAIQGYIDKLVAVRGEFEMQSRSLEILLQNKKESNELWNQTVQLAVKSPFKVKELVTYTKQLAAYRIESDKLFETNKMLADVSAGLGVDMQRLILAFGQVKAANFLRGTELRQFSEAGVNMLDELAGMLSEVEGRIISVGDVFEMISNRQVSFEHVEEVFKRITAPGGLFYQMQEKQSETTKGMMLNLHDSIELMMNDIGISYEGVIKGGIDVLRSLVENWRTIAPVLKTIVYSFGFNLIRKGILSLSPLLASFWKGIVAWVGFIRKAFATGATASEIFRASMIKLSTISFSGWLSIITIIGMVATAIYQAVNATDKLGEELNRIDQDLSKQLTDNIELYKELAEKVKDVTASEYDRNQALAEMKRAFQDILPDEMLRAENIASYGENYEKAEKAMRSYYNSEKLMQQEEAIEKETLGDIGGKVERLSERLSDTIDINYNGRQEKEVVKRYKDGVSRIINEIVRDVKNGKISASAETLQEELTNRLVAFVNIPEANNALKRAIKNQIWGASDVWVDLLDVSDPLKEYEEKVANIQPLLGATWDEEQMEKQAAQIQQQVTIVQNAYKTIAKLASQKATGDVASWEDILPNINKALQEVQTNAPAYYNALNAVWVNLKSNAEEGTFKFNSELQKLGDGFNETIADVIVQTNEGNNAAINFSEGLRKALDDEQLSQSGKAVVQIFEEVAQSMELDPDVFSKFIPTAKKSLADIRTMLEGEIGNIQDQIRRMNTSMASGVSGALMSMLFFLKDGQTPEQKIAELEKLLKAYEGALNRLGGPKTSPKTKKNTPKKTKKSKSSTKSDDPAENLYEHLEEMYDAFQDFNEEMSAEAANAKVAEIYGEEFKELEAKVKGLNLTLPKFKQDDEEPYLAALGKVYDKAAKKTQDKIDDEKAKAKKEQEVVDAKERNDETEREIDLLFEQYELYKSLKELGVSEKQAKALFGLDVASLKDINKELERLKNEGKLAGTRMAKVEQEAFDKIAKEETKIQEERLKKYIEYANKAVSERAKIEIEYLNRLAEIEEATLVKDDDTEDSIAYKNSIREAATQKALKEYQDGLKKIEWDEFQKSDIFLMMFEDLDSANEKLIRNTLEKIKRYKEEWADMPLEDVRAMTEKINQLESALLKLKNPWKAIKDIDKTISETLNGKTREEVNAEAIDAQSKIDQNNVEIGQLETIRTLLAKGKYISLEQSAIYQQITGDTEANLETIEAEIDARKDANKELNEPIETAKKLTKAEKDKIDAYHAQSEVYDTINSEAQKLYDASKELIGLFADDDSMGMMFADMGMSIADSVLSTLSLQMQLKAASVSAQGFGAALNSAMGIIGWIVMGVQILSQVLGAIFGAKDKKLQKEIDKLDDDVEKLSKSLEKLEESLDKNYAFASLRSDMQQLNSNIELQIAKRRRQIELEKDKKETDKDQIKDWEEEIQELEEKRAEVHREMIESLGGVEDIRSTTRDFVDAWVDAFNETGDGLSGLRDNFREFFKNILLEQAVMKGAGKILEPLLNEINTSLDDYEIQGHEEQKIKTLSEQKMKELDVFLEQLFGENGMWNEWIDDKGSSLSGLQEGIQGVTEETAQIIEAYLNSIRFYIAQDNQNLADLRNFFVGSDDSVNPMLAQLKIIATQTTAIHDLLDGVTRAGHSQGGRGIKVFID